MLVNELATQIADELGRSDLDKHIQRAIESAITYYERKPLGFNETSLDFAVKAGQERVILPKFCGRLTGVYIKANGHRSRLTRLARNRHFQGFGMPSYYASGPFELFLLPIPHQKMSLHIEFIKLYSGKQKDAFLDKICDLIHAHAKADLCLNILRSPQEAEMYRKWATDLYQNLLDDKDNQMEKLTIKSTIF